MIPEIPDSSPPVSSASDDVPTAAAETSEAAETTREMDRQLTAYAVTANPPLLRRASREREWMDETPDRFAYRCLPLVIGNQLGWDILNPLPFRARWNGGPRPTDVVVEPMDAEDANGKLLASGHFGQAVLTFSVDYLFRTPPGIGLLVCGPPNSPKDGLFALTGVVETDWTCATFTMNYRFTRRRHWVEFAANEPFCRIIPVDRFLLEGLGSEIRNISDNPDLESQYRAWQKSRSAFNEGLKNPFSAEAEQGWQREYFQGRAASGERAREHQTQLRHKEFVDHRPNAEKEFPKPKKSRAPTPSRPKRETAAHYLWENTDLYDLRRENFVTVLAGMVRFLQSKRPLGGAEDSFLQSFDRMRSLRAEEFSSIWSEPRAFHWTRVAFELLDNLVNDSTPGAQTRRYVRHLKITDSRQALSSHLDGFRLFELGAALAFGHELAWEEPLSVTLPRAFPGTRWSLVGSGSVEITGFASGRLRLGAGGREYEVVLEPGTIGGTGISVVQCNLTSHGDAHLRVQPEAIAELGLAEALPAIATTGDFRNQAAAIIEEALQHIAELDPRSYRFLARETRIIAPKPPIGEYANSTFSTLPGAMILSVVPHSLEMADRIVHEVHHDRLFCIEDFNALLEDQGEKGPDVERYYSPWREDPRPVRGILHGLYVFIAVGRFWLKVFTKGDIPSGDRDYASERLRRTLGQLNVAVTVLEAHARFTAFGTGIFEQLRKNVDDLCSAVDEAGVPEDPQALVITDDGSIKRQVSAISGELLSVNEALREHQTLFGAATVQGQL